MTDAGQAETVRWDERYRTEAYAFGVEPNGFLAAQRDRLKAGMRALVPGDGEGRNGVWLAGLGLAVDTLDLSAIGVAKARRLAATRGLAINAIQADALAWDWPRERYDLVALIFLHLAEPDRRSLHEKALAALRPGGLIVLEAFRPEQIERQARGAHGGPHDVRLLASLAALAEDFGRHDILALEEAEIALSEGARHVGDCAVVRALVRRR
jgi:SAM-dependent methyltransferase